MALFDGFKRDNSLKVVKVLSAGSGNVNGFDYVGTITSSTKETALKQFKNKMSQGMFNEPKKETKTLTNVVKKEKKVVVPLPTVETHKIKKAIYSDFNGVLDDRERDGKTSHRESPVFRVPAIACPHKIFKLAKLAVDNNASVVLTSMWRTYGLDFYCIILRSLLHSEIQAYVDYAKENKKILKELTRIEPTDERDSRTNEIREHIIKNEFTHFVVFEDDHFISEELNPVMTNWSVGLLDEHIEKASIYLK